MANFSKPIAVANGWVNLLTLMRAAGYTGHNIVSSLAIFNPEAANLVYIHLTDNGLTNPSTGTDGWPIGAGATAVGNTFYSDRGANAGSLDLGTTWIFAAAVFNIKVLAVGT